jgi:hypothetical protein
MLRILTLILRGIKEQLVGKKPAYWVAYTQSGKVVLIEGMQVIKVLDLSKLPKEAPQGRSP